MQLLNAVLYEEIDEIMEMQHLVNNPKYQKLWGTIYGNELGRL